MLIAERGWLLCRSRTTGHRLFIEAYTHNNTNLAQCRHSAHKSALWVQKNSLEKRSRSGLSNSLRPLLANGTGGRIPRLPLSASRCCLCLAVSVIDAPTIAWPLIDVMLMTPNWRVVYSRNVRSVVYHFNYKSDPI